MVEDSLVAINIVDKNRVLYNKEMCPLLYYWNGDGSLLEELSHDENFIKLLAENLKQNPHNYVNLQISYFYFKFIDNEDKYESNITDLQDALCIETLDNIGETEIANFYIIKHLNELYKNAFKKDFEIFSQNGLNIIEIYNVLKEKYGKRVSTETIKNWLRSVLISEDKLTQVNTEYIITEFEKIIKEHELPKQQNN